jgi:hypothetical protein
VTTRHRGGDRPLRNEQEVVAALDSFISENDDLLSRAGSIDELSRWVAGEIGEGKGNNELYKVPVLVKILKFLPKRDTAPVAVCKLTNSGEVF